MKIQILNLTGEKLADQELPEQFGEPVRSDLIKRAVLALQSKRRNVYGANPRAGKRQVSWVSRRRRDYKASYGRGISRVPRKVLSRSGSQFNWEGAMAPGTKGGRRAHPPKSEKKLAEEINKKENKKAIRSAIAASIDKNIVAKRGHKVPDNFPFVVDDKFESLKKTKDVEAALEKLKLTDELKRCSTVGMRAGKGKMRNRKYVTKKGPLIVVSKPCSAIKACANILGVDVAHVHKLNAEYLAPGCEPGRLTLWTQSAIKEIKEKNMFK
ncbi:50S ribosomal protein L4 [Candidatus Woesearchaeota archaeon]|nr:50S ribosomal protein L4 [Candidatus Woesearchaeota archaeon]